MAHLSLRVIRSRQHRCEKRPIFGAAFTCAADLRAIQTLLRFSCAYGTEPVSASLRWQRVAAFRSRPSIWFGPEPTIF
jgi:hypothetical protein